MFMVPFSHNSGAPSLPSFQADQLLCGWGPAASSSKMVQLAALGEGLDYVADAVLRYFQWRYTYHITFCNLGPITLFTF